MAQFYWSAEDYDVGVEPSDAWAPQANVTTWEIESDEDGKYLRVEGPASERTFLRFLGAPSSLDTEVWARLKPRDGGADWWLYARGSNEDNVDVVSATRIDYDGGDGRVSEFSDGGFNLLDSTNINVGQDDLFECRGGYSADHIRGKWWLSTESEPENWMLDELGTVALEGRQGVGHWSGGGFHVYAFGVGTEGDAAPTGPIGVHYDETLSVSMAAYTKTEDICTVTETAEVALPQYTLVGERAALAEMVLVAAVQQLEVTDVVAKKDKYAAIADGKIIEAKQNCTERGFVYGLSSHGDPGSIAPEDTGYTSYVSEQGVFSEGVFSLELEYLEESETYYVRAYAYSEGRYSYGNEISFDVVVDLEILGVSAVSVVAVEEVHTPATFHYEEVLSVGVVARTEVSDLRVLTEIANVLSPLRVAVVDTKSAAAVLAVAARMSVPVVDTGAAAEIMTTAAPATLTVTDYAGMSELALVGLQMYAEAIHRVSQAESVQVGSLVRVSVVDGAVFVDVAAAGQVVRGAVTDILAAVEAVHIAGPVTVSVTDIQLAAIEELLAVGAAASTEVTDTAAKLENVYVAGSLQVAAVHTKAQAETFTAVASVSITAVDSHTLTERPQVEAVLSFAVTDTARKLDVAQVGFAVGVQQADSSAKVELLATHGPVSISVTDILLAQFEELLRVDAPAEVAAVDREAMREQLRARLRISVDAPAYQGRVDALDIALPVLVQVKATSVKLERLAVSGPVDVHVADDLLALLEEILSVGAGIEMDALDVQDGVDPLAVQAPVQVSVSDILPLVEELLQVQMPVRKTVVDRARRRDIIRVHDRRLVDISHRKDAVERPVISQPLRVSVPDWLQAVEQVYVGMPQRIILTDRLRIGESMRVDAPLRVMSVELYGMRDVARVDAPVSVAVLHTSARQDMILVGIPVWVEAAIAYLPLRLWAQFYVRALPPEFWLAVGCEEYVLRAVLPEFWLEGVRRR